MSRSNTSMAAELSEAQQRRKEADERKKAVARRAWESGEVSKTQLCTDVGVDWKTLTRWIEEWRKV